MSSLSADKPINEPTQTVSVVIPTIGRRELGRAIKSVLLQQTRHIIEIIVIIDLPKEQITADLLQAISLADKSEITGGGRKGAYARNRGIALGSGEWVAFLDDDDYWDQNKIERQMDAALMLRDSGSVPVVGSRVQLEYPNLNSVPKLTPIKLVDETQRIWEYLFHKRRPGAGRSSFPTSTLLLPMRVARDTWWNENLTRHQDWDFLVRLARKDRIVFHQIEDSAVIYNVGSAGSISASSDWKASLDWAAIGLQDTSRSTIAEFLVAQTLRYALQAKSMRGVMEVVNALTRNGKIPSPQSTIVGLSGILGRKNLERVMGVLK